MGCTQGGLVFDEVEMNSIRHYLGLYLLLLINNTRLGAILALLRKPSF